jgi:MerR family transcriptional regulator, thiopeptide resistance regulator
MLACGYRHGGLAPDVTSGLTVGWRTAKEAGLAAQRTWRIGELAGETGITVRTLHYYDQLGLLSPSSRTSGGHRCYTSGDVQRLHRIIALRSCGLSLGETKTALDADAYRDLAGLLRRQLEVADERIRQAVAVRVRLAGILDALGRMAEPSVTEILRLIEETITMNQPLTPQRFAELKEERARRAREMSAEEFAALNQKREQAWAALSREGQARLLEQLRQMVPAAG